MTDIAELLKVSPLDEKNELVDATPGEIKATLLTYLEQTDNDKLSRQGTAEAFGSHMQVDQVVDGMTTFKMYFNQ